MNMDPQGLDFEIPDVSGRQWHRVVDTALPPPQDIAEPERTSADRRRNGPARRGAERGRAVVTLSST